MINNPRFTPAYIATATTTTLATGGGGTVHTITVTGGTAGTIVVYDNPAATGNILASFTATNTPQTYTLDVAFSYGLTVVTGAATQLTISWTK